MSNVRRPPARLWVILARDAPTGVIFRRGPSKQVLLIKWDTATDQFQTGQWFKGRIYERRCDLSPDGKLLIYFAANQKPPLFAWTAVSKPPFFTALALWPKGDTWNGGGAFADNRNVWLNHPRDAAELAPGLRLGPLKIAGYADERGEDATVWDVVLKRDGWHLMNAGKTGRPSLEHGWVFDTPRQWAKPHRTRGDTALEMSIHGIAGPNRPWYDVSYRVLGNTQELIDLGRADWADWDRGGDLLFAKGGCIFRQSLASDPVELANFNDLTFENVKAPAHAQQW